MSAPDGFRAGEPARRRGLRTAIAVGVLYFVYNEAVVWLAGAATAAMARIFWRWSAFVVCGALFAAHVAYEHYRLRSPAPRTAWHATLAVALGTFALALAANVHDLGTPEGYRPRMLVALVAWPLLTAVPAYIAARLAAAVLPRGERRG